ncbi:FAD-binding protein [Saccharomonospora cyanea]|uniref:FAD/FMN-dependent dehydrogenase n=1 Tax=Saccharomonospora cyanea NA-134 TaxID=882082 RepID=H5XMD7_9PSEU|nr:FAD-binding protein [Saccharomonospora cyanea]EHR59886.1 FAD/FMN-dependent dehydrogenase [Saccharomonospora cyanea NA-134]
MSLAAHLSAFLPASADSTCTVTDDEATLSRFARDWGGLVRLRPGAVVRPSSTADVAAVLSFASDTGTPVVPRGSGHSCFGQSLTEGGLVLDLTGMARVHPGVGAEVVADAGASWRRVTESALARGLTPKVLPDYLGLSVGGTLSVGGVGGASHRHGAQTDTVTELEVVTGSGEVVRCSPEREPELFDAVRAGSGWCGVITRATVALGGAAQRARRRKLYYRDLATFVADQRTVVAEERFDHVEGRALLDVAGEWLYRVDTTSYFLLPSEVDETTLLDGLSFDASLTETAEYSYGGFCDRMADGEVSLRDSGEWFRPHPWLTVFLPDDAVTDVVAHALAGLEPGASDTVLLYPLRADRIATPLLRLPRAEPTDTPVWLLGLLTVADPRDPIGLARELERNAALYERVVAAGGTVYPGSALPRGSVDRQCHFGDAWSALTAARRRYDPADVLAAAHSW